MSSEGTSIVEGIPQKILKFRASEIAENASILSVNGKK